MCANMFVLTKVHWKFWINIIPLCVQLWYRRNYYTKYEGSKFNDEEGRRSTQKHKKIVITKYQNDLFFKANTIGALIYIWVKYETSMIRCVLGKAVHTQGWYCYWQQQWQHTTDKSWLHLHLCQMSHNMLLLKQFK